MFSFVKGLFTDTYKQSEQESRDVILTGNGKADFKVMVICITVAFSIVMVRYFGDTFFTLSFLESIGATQLYLKLGHLFLKSEGRQLYSLLWWVSLILVFYLAVPVIIIKCWFKERLTDYGVKLKGAFKDYWLYIVMLLIMLPLVFHFSKTVSFQERYPFYKPATGEPLFPRFIVWEVFYFLHFLAVEFFFRGFMVHGTKKRFGYYSVFVMMIPYCMVHFGKPFPETMAAIVAGLVLGTLSLKSRSIMLGVAIHYSVAITMDMFALWYIR